MHPCIGLVQGCPNGLFLQGGPGGGALGSADDVQLEPVARERPVVDDRGGSAVRKLPCHEAPEDARCAWELRAWPTCRGDARPADARPLVHETATQARIASEIGQYSPLGQGVRSASVSSGGVGAGRSQRFGHPWDGDRGSSCRRAAGRRVVPERGQEQQVKTDAEQERDIPCRAQSS